MYYRGKRVLVTGASGFIGGRFTDALAARGARVRAAFHVRPLPPRPGVEAFRADLTRREDCLAACRDMEIVVHAAGSVGAAGIGPALAMAGIVDNLTLTGRVLEAAWSAGADRVLVFGSSTAYPPADHPVREEEMWSGDPYPGYFGYGWMRRAVERLAEYTARESGMGVAVCRPTAVYGPGDNMDPATCHVIPALIRRAVARENPFVVWGTGDEVRDFLHVADLVEGCLLLLEKKADADPVNIGAGHGVSIREAAAIILEAAGHAGVQAVFDPSRPTALPVRLADTAKARTLLGFRPRYGLREGLAETVAWWRNAGSREAP